MQIERFIYFLKMTAVASHYISNVRNQATKLPRPTCYRLMHTMTENRFLYVQEDALHSVFTLEIKNIYAIFTQKWRQPHNYAMA